MLAALTFHMNDAGSGLCWCSALYCGAQGPAQCRSLDPGVRVQRFVEALKQAKA